MVENVCLIHTHTRACARARTYVQTHMQKGKAKPSAVLAQLHLTSESTLGHLCTTQVLEVSADKSSWDWISNPYHVSQVKVWAPEVPPGSSPPSQYQVPIDVTDGWAVSPIDN